MAALFHMAVMILLLELGEVYHNFAEAINEYYSASNIEHEKW